MAYIVMAYVVMAYIVMAYIVMAKADLWHTAVATGSCTPRVLHPAPRAPHLACDATARQTTAHHAMPHRKAQEVMAHAGMAYVVMTYTVIAGKHKVMTQQLWPT